MPRAKKGEQKVPTFKETRGLCPSRCYYSMTYMICAWPPWVSWHPVDPWCPYSIPIWSALDPPGSHGTLLTPGVPILYLYDLRLTLLGVMAPCWPLVSLFYTCRICAWPSWVSWHPIDPWCPYSIPVWSALDPPGCHGALLTPGVARDVSLQVSLPLQCVGIAALKKYNVRNKENKDFDDVIRI